MATSFDDFRAPHILAGDQLLLRTSNGEVRSVKADKDSNVTLGRLGAVPSSELIGQPYGMSYELLDKKLKFLPPKTLLEIEETDATNELINDGVFVQPLTGEEIEAFKQGGVHVSDIIKRQIEQHTNYSLKTEYSKEKYKKRKEAKYGKTVTSIEPTAFNVCEYWFNKDQNRIRSIRADSLAQMMNMGNVRPGGRYLVVDDASGLIVSAMLERMGGEGRLITICDADSPPAYPVLQQMNFKKEIVAQVMTALNWSTVNEDYEPILNATEPTPIDPHSDRQKTRLNKRKVVLDALAATREELFAGEFDGLIVASEYEPYSIIDKLMPYLGGSASIVVHSPYVQILTDLQGKMRPNPQFLGPLVTEGFLRRYQVLPGRTHPTMSTSGTGGFILHTTKVYDDPTATSVVVHRQHRKKPKTAEASAAASGTATPAAATEENTTAEATATTLVVKAEDVEMDNAQS